MAFGFAKALKASLPDRAAARLPALRMRLRAGARSGSAMIEFALVAPVFFILLFGILETGLMFYGQFALQNATSAAARLIRTGIAQNTDYATAAKCGSAGASGGYGDGQQWFAGQICCGISGILSDCADSLHVSVQSYSGGFGGAGFASTETKDANGNPTGLYQPVSDTYEPGNACDVVLVRATYSWPVMTPVLSFFLVNMANNDHLLVATAAFRNEPFNNDVAGC